MHQPNYCEVTMKTILLALLAAVSLGMQTLAIAEDEPNAAATQDSVPADTNAMPDTPTEPAAIEQGSGSDAMPAPTESESK
jgi:hypothetical protein